MIVELSEIKLLQKSRLLHLQFSDGQHFTLSCEYLRVFSPSAEVRGHFNEEAILVAGKQHVNIIGIDPVGHYAIKLIFDDGHDSGIFTWEYLHDLAQNQQHNWQNYLARLKAAGLSR